MTDHQSKLVFIFAPPATLILLSVITLAVGGFPDFMAPWPFLIAIFAVGLPHGASDFVMSRRLDGTSVSATFFRFGWYVAIMTCVLASLAIAPLFVIGAFGLLSAWHFGRADAEDLDDISPMRSERSIPKAVWALSRGFLVVLLPFVCSFEISLSILNMLLAWCGSAALNASDEWRLNLAAFLAGCLITELASILQSLAERNIRRAGVEMLELIAIASCFGTLHPLFASGVYFLAWHSWRHLRRLNRVINHESLWSFGLQSMISLHRDSLILLIPTAFAVPVIAFQLGGDLTPSSLCLSSLLVYVIVTLPHELLCRRLFASLSRGTSAHRNLELSSGVLTGSLFNEERQADFRTIPKSRPR
ncbi:MAG: Brp/Blh family beta-carotene 15,15'-dioxygenase [Planctomycetota bacterium]